jgi:hypothetical protein
LIWIGSDPLARTPPQPIPNFTHNRKQLFWTKGIPKLINARAENGNRRNRRKMPVRRLQAMKKITTIWLALIIGGAFQGLVYGVASLFGKCGPCGPTNWAAGIFFMIHMPVYSAGSYLFPDNAILAFSFSLVALVLFWSMIAFLIIYLIRRRYVR